MTGKEMYVARNFQMTNTQDEKINQQDKKTYAQWNDSKREKVQEAWLNNKCTER